MRHATRLIILIASLALAGQAFARPHIMRFNQAATPAPCAAPCPLPIAGARHVIRYAWPGNTIRVARCQRQTPWRVKCNEALRVRECFGHGCSYVWWPGADTAVLRRHRPHRDGYTRCMRWRGWWACDTVDGTTLGGNTPDLVVVVASRSR